MGVNPSYNANKLLASRIGCGGLAPAVSDVSFGPDPIVIVNRAVDFKLRTPESAANTPSSKRAVVTSAPAANQMRWNERYDMTPNSWNELSVEMVWAPPLYTQKRSFMTYSESKTEAEQELWKFTKE
jgi:hypothetical protein